jgi:hypothetical protein
LALVQDLAFVREAVNDLKIDNKNINSQIDIIKNVLLKIESRLRERELDSVSRLEHQGVLSEVNTVRNSQTKTNLYFYIIFTSVNIGLILFLKYY